MCLPGEYPGCTYVSRLFRRAAVTIVSPIRTAAMGALKMPERMSGAS